MEWFSNLSSSRQRLIYTSLLECVHWGWRRGAESPRRRFFHHGLVDCRVAQWRRGTAGEFFQFLGDAKRHSITDSLVFHVVLMYLSLLVMFTAKEGDAYLVYVRAMLFGWRQEMFTQGVVGIDLLYESFTALVRALRRFRVTVRDVSYGHDCLCRGTGCKGDATAHCVYSVSGDWYSRSFSDDAVVYESEG